MKPLKDRAPACGVSDVIFGNSSSHEQVTPISIVLLTYDSILIQEIL